MQRSEAIRILRKMRGRYLGDGFTKAQVSDLITAYGTEALPVPFVSKQVPEMVSVVREKLKKGYVFHSAWPHREYKVLKLERIELWPSRALIAQFAYSHEVDGHFFYKTKYEDGSYQVIHGIRDAGEQIGYVEVIDIHTEVISKMFVRLI